MLLRISVRSEFELGLSSAAGAEFSVGNEANSITIAHRMRGYCRIEGSLTRGFAVNRSKLFRHILKGILRLDIVFVFLTLRQLHFFAVRFLVWDLAQQVADDIEPGSFLVVAADYVPRRPGGVRRREHCIPGP